MQGILKKLSGYTWKPAVQFWLRAPRGFTIDDIKLRIDPGVFHPGFFFSSKEMYRFLRKMDLDERRVIEIGCGSGLLSILCAKKGADVTAIDISKKAIDCTRVNAVHNNCLIRSYKSDLFSEVPERKFDLILVNPPYFPSDPVKEEDHAWYAGKDFRFFDGLFAQGVSRLNPAGEMLMVLSDECDRKKIFAIASSHGWKSSLVSERKNLWERILIYRLIR